MRYALSATFAALLALSSFAVAETIEADPTNYKSKAGDLRPGDILQLAAGDYVNGLTLGGLNGTKDAWIIIRGPETGAPARLLGDPNRRRNTLEMRSNVTYVAIENITFEGNNIADVFAISATGSNIHHIRVEGCTILGHGVNQGTVGLSTKTTTWGWVIRGNRFIDFGTGMYLGNSDGTVPFIGGLIEYNLFHGARGYCFQIKHQNNRPNVAGVPTTPQRTIIRHNVLIKGDASGNSGPRPNMLLGTFPDTGNGSEDLYEVYGNLFMHNHQESLVQATGRVIFHDNLFVDCVGETALYLTDHNGPLKLAHVYNNTFYVGGRGIRFADRAREEHKVVGNLVLMDSGISGSFDHDVGNMHDTAGNAGQYVNNPSLKLGELDLFPKIGSAAKGDSLDLTDFISHTQSALDYNGQPKGQVLYRGAYQGEGDNGGWQLAAGIKNQLAVNADSTPPTGAVSIDGGAATTESTSVTLTLAASDDGGMDPGGLMRFSNDGKSWSASEPYATEFKGWDLTTNGGSSEPGKKSVFAQFRDAAGNWSTAEIVASITLETTEADAPPASGGGCSIAPRGAKADGAWLALLIALSVLGLRRRGS